MTDIEFKEKVMDLFFGKTIDPEEAIQKLEKDYSYIRENRKLGQDFDNFKESGLNFLNGIKRKINSL